MGKVHPLQDYLDYREMNVVQFAKAIGCSKNTIYMVIKGKKPRRRTAVKIQEATRRLVTIKDFGYE